jgi:hypothetical protein
MDSFPDYIKKAHGIYQALRFTGIPPEYIFLRVDSERGVLVLTLDSGTSQIDYYVGAINPEVETKAVILLFAAFDADANESERNRAYMDWFESTNQEMFMNVLIDAGYTPGKEIARA